MEMETLSVISDVFTQKKKYCAHKITIIEYCTNVKHFIHLQKILRTQAMPSTYYYNIEYCKATIYITAILKNIQQSFTLMKTLTFLLSFSLLFLSCAENVDIDVKDISPTTKGQENYFAISKDSALSNLYSFLDDVETASTRTSQKNIVSSITPIKYRSIKTRNATYDIDCDNILYIANFEDESGYAILAGDKRITEKVLVITDDGSLDDKTMYTAIELASNERIIINEYPTTGDGFFTTPETGDELFINPNTVLLYNDSVQDTFVGNFNLDNIGAEDENGNAIFDNTETLNGPEVLTSALCISYAANKIEEYNNIPCDNQITHDDANIAKSRGGSKTTTKEITSAWKTKSIVSPILTDFVKWHQKEPFNDLYPKRRRYLFFGHKRKALAGCFPLTVSKLLTYYEYPTTFKYNGYTVNWKELKKSFQTDKGKTSAAHLLKAVSSACGSWYFYAGTFTFPHKVTSFMRSIGLNDAHSHSYNFERVTAMIDNGCPIIIYSVPGINVFKSHSWNIDGYKIKERTITTNTYVGTVLTKSKSKIETCKMVHCDFGWKGKCNGYYVSGIFKLNDPNIEHDAGTQYGGKTNYNNLIKVITYNKPL